LKIDGLAPVGVELSAWAAQRARQRGHLVYEGRLETQTFPAESFDAAVLLDLIEHVDSPRGLLRRCRALLRPGGLLFIGTPNFGLYSRLGERYPGLRTSLEHIHYFDAHSLERLLETEQFQVEELVSCNAADPVSEMVNDSAFGRLAFACWRRLKPLVRSSYGRLRALASRRLRQRRNRALRGASLLAIASQCP
jgi:SAM-dependent methyltransferase